MERISEYCITLNAGTLTAKHADYTSFYQHRVKVYHICFLCLSNCALQQSARQLKVQQKSSEVNKMRNS